MARGGRGRGGGGQRESLPRDVQVSKKMSWLLRHGAEKEGLKLDEAGYINLHDLLNNRTIRSLKVTFEEVRHIVETNDKKRFTMIPVPSSSAEDVESPEENEQTPLPSQEPRDYLIRANQGHSLKVESEGLLKPITADLIPPVAVHGTTHANWTMIVASGGLKPMGRNHVHFASGLPEGFKSVVDSAKDDVDAPVISGMRKSSTVLVYLDISKAMEHGINFWVSENGVILTEGNADQLLPMQFFKRVEDRTGFGVLVEDGQLIKEAPSSWAPRGRR